MKLIARVDANQPAIVEGLRAAGCSVEMLHRVGHGVPDLLVGHGGQTYGPYEVKVGTGKLSPDQVKWWGAWRGGGKVVHCAEDILQDIGLMKQGGFCNRGHSVL